MKLWIKMQSLFILCADKSVFRKFDSFFSDKRKGFSGQAQNIKGRGRRNYDDQRKLGTVGKGLFKSICIIERELKRASEAGRTVRYQTGVSERQRPYYPLQGLPQAEG